jgi:hypothetical protein
MVTTDTETTVNAFDRLAEWSTLRGLETDVKIFNGFLISVKFFDPKPYFIAVKRTSMEEAVEEVINRYEALNVD